MSALRDDRLERDPERDSLSRLERDSLGRLVDPKRHHMQALLNGMWATQQFQWRKPRLGEFLSQEPPFNYTCLCMHIRAYNDYAVRAIMRFMCFCAAHEHDLFRKFFGIDDSIRDAVKAKSKAGLVSFREGITEEVREGISEITYNKMVYYDSQADKFVSSTTESFCLFLLASCGSWLLAPHFSSQVQ